MEKRVKALFKIFRKEQYRDEFKKGLLYFNTLEFFKNIEDPCKFCIADDCEGVVGFYQPDKIKLQFGRLDITDLAGPVTIRKNDLACYNLLSLASINDGEFKASEKYTLEEIKKGYSFLESINSIGDYAILITDTNEFIHRIEIVAKEQNYTLMRGLVEYYDSRTFNGNFSCPNKFFHKKNEFSYQKEYRFVLEKNERKNAPIVLNIGNISDICVDLFTREINDKISIKVN